MKQDTTNSTCDVNQYQLLKECSEKCDLTSWNSWRKGNPDAVVQLAGAEFRDFFLEGADFDHACLMGAEFIDSRMKGASFRNADVCNARIVTSDLAGVDFAEANLQNSKLLFVELGRANLYIANLRGTSFDYAYMKGVTAFMAIVDGETKLQNCTADNRTDFRGVGLGNARMLQGFKQLLEYNIRRLDWEDWYKEHRWLRFPAKTFWAISDYGLSTSRVLGTFVIVAYVFSMVYTYWALIDLYVFENSDPPGIIDRLWECYYGNCEALIGLRIVVRSIYFSVITMCTVGFGDLHAKAQSIAGQVLVVIQVLSGYFILGALITRLSILFTTGVPVRKFSQEPARQGDGKLAKKSSSPGVPRRSTDS